MFLVMALKEEKKLKTYANIGSTTDLHVCLALKESVEHYSRIYHRSTILDIGMDREDVTSHLVPNC